MLKYMTAGESHGRCLIAILEGMPRGVKIDQDLINQELKKRQGGYGRGRRMQIESDKVKILSGIRKNITTAAPIAMLIQNKDNTLEKLPPLVCPRPGHADLPGMLKYNIKDARDILERASARETASRVAAGNICRQFLSEFDIDIFSHIKSLGPVKSRHEGLGVMEIKRLAARSAFSCVDRNAQDLMKEIIDKAGEQGDTLGGVFEVIAVGLPVGLGNCMQYDKKLDAQLAFELISIQAIKAISFGAGIEAAQLFGSEVHDNIYYQNKKFKRNSNNGGGIEGGMSNGEPIRISCFMKPISTLMRPLDSVNVKTKKHQKAAIERSDISALYAASVVAENVAAVVLAKAMLEKFGTDSLDEIKRNYRGYVEQVREF